MSMNGGHTGIKDVFHVIRQSPALMIAAIVGGGLLILLLIKKNGSGGSTTTTAVDSSTLPNMTSPGSYYSDVPQSMEPIILSINPSGVAPVSTGIGATSPGPSSVTIPSIPIPSVPVTPIPSSPALPTPSIPTGATIPSVPPPVSVPATGATIPSSPPAASPVAKATIPSTDPLHTAGESDNFWVYTTRPGDTLASLTSKFNWNSPQQKGGGPGFTYNYRNNKAIFDAVGINPNNPNATIPVGININA